jgi:excisionase family DNA binding protein
MLRLLVLSNQRSSPVPCKDLCLVAISTGWTNAQADRKRSGVIKTMTPRTQHLKRLFSLPEAAEYLGRSTWSVRRLIWSGELPQVRAGGRIHVDLRDMEQFIERNKLREPPLPAA